MATAVDDGLVVDLLPAEMGLINYPNPFNANTKISFNIPLSGFVDLSVYDLTGRAIRKLIRENMPVGLHEVVWDGRNDNGDQLVSGIYFVRIATEHQAKTHRLVLIK